MNKENIDSVISYYDINDEWYHKQCYACMIVMDTSVSLKQKLDELLDM
ncbi:hypothetical protein [Solobacterium moorei]|nr:hypothetical protein [Solobacterium moorei]